MDAFEPFALLFWVAWSFQRTRVGPHDTMQEQMGASREMDGHVLTVVVCSDSRNLGFFLPNQFDSSSKSGSVRFDACDFQLCHVDGEAVRVDGEHPEEHDSDT